MYIYTVEDVYMVRMNITIPDDVAKELGHLKNKSRFIAEAVRDRFRREQKRRREALLIEGYKKMADEDKNIGEEWDKEALADGWE